MLLDPFFRPVSFGLRRWLWRYDFIGFRVARRVQRANWRMVKSFFFKPISHSIAFS